MAFGLYDSNGQLRLTETDGTTFTGAYAPDGSQYIVFNDGSTYTGLYHPSGAMNAVMYYSGESNGQAPNGSIHVINNTEGTGFTSVGSMGSSKTMRAMNVSHAWTQGFETSGGSSFGRLSRIRLKSKTKITSIQVVYATFWLSGTTATGFTDQDLPTPLNIQAALEYPWTDAKTAIPASRPNFKFSGSNTYAYGGTGTNSVGYILSDKLTPTGGIPANTSFGIWSSVEPPTSQPQTIAITALSSSGTTATATVASTAGLYVNQVCNVTGASVTAYNNQMSQITAIVPNTSFSYTTASSGLAAATTATAVPQFIPWNIQSSSALDRNEGTTASTSSAGSHVATNAVSNATSVSAYNVSAVGVSAGFVPAFLLIDYASGEKCVFILGDSTEFGTSAGAATNVIGRDGDSMGTTDHALSWMDQGVYLNAGLNYVNAGKGGDGAKFLRTASTWPLRRNLMVLANPTHIINGMAFNDQGQAASATWQAATSYVRGTVAVKGGNTYLQLNGTSTSGVTSGATGPSGTTVGVYETDGACKWAYLGASTYAGAQGFGWNMVLNDLIKAEFPGIKIYNTTMMPNATYSSLVVLGDQSVTAANQNARNNFNNYIKTRSDVLGNTGYFDPNPYVENDPVTGDCKWIVDGSTANLVSFGAHFNSNGNRLAAAAITSSSIV